MPVIVIDTPESRAGTSRSFPPSGYFDLLQTGRSKGATAPIFLTGSETELRATLTEVPGVEVVGENVSARPSSLRHLPKRDTGGVWCTWALSDASKYGGGAPEDYERRNRKSLWQQTIPCPYCFSMAFAGAAPTWLDASPHKRSISDEKRETGLFGIEGRRNAPGELHEDIALLSRGNLRDVQAFLEDHLFSDRFYSDRGVIWIELPERDGEDPSALVTNWFHEFATYAVASFKGAPSLWHAVPAEWDATLCQLPLDRSSQIRHGEPADVTCRWCLIQLTALDIVRDHVSRG